MYFAMLGYVALRNKMDQGNLLMGIVIQCLNGNNQETIRQTYIYPNYHFLSLSPAFSD